MHLELPSSEAKAKCLPRLKIDLEYEERNGLQVCKELSLVALLDVDVKRNKVIDCIVFILCSKNEEGVSWTTLSFAFLRRRN